MIKKLPLLFLLSFISFSSFSQLRRTIINGKVTDSLSTVKNANIINLKTNQGTFSSDDGEFRIFVKTGDSLRISSIQHITKFIIINKNNLANKFVDVKLTYSTVVLDTFELKRHNLSGRLGIDSKNVPTNKKDSLLNDLLDFSDIDMNVVAPDDHIDKMKPPVNNTDPTANFAGAGAAVVMPFKDSERLWALRKELARKKQFPYKIMSELGEKFFFEKLKIPIDKYFHFLEYCNPLGIEKLHKDGKVLDIIKIFQTESKSYLKIIKKE
ncbi:hypothetical protein [uncultured Polaribacter sp.]|uniref:hypothetical protein n=1 Tax=uncultured Polaribacter sp. TaxID=174711 RepID=UPI00260DB19E|nr:hypothetical protein [uncultured Polaribacter sp.]